MNRLKTSTLAGILLLVAATAMSPDAIAQKKNAKRRQRDQAAALAGSQAEIYKTIGKVELKIHIFKPKNHKPGDNRAAVVFFFGGGWRAGSPTQFGRHCQYLASRGMVAMTADYRVESRQQVKVPACIADAKSAIRWVRMNAKRLGIDPNRIAAGGGSAGGHLAATTGTLKGFDEPSEKLAVSSRPNAMLLFNPALDLTAKGFHAEEDSERIKSLHKRIGIDPKNVSPLFHVSTATPPTIIFHGQGDTTVPYT